MKELQADIKDRSFKRVYLLFGDERFLVNMYVRSIANAVIAPEERLMSLDTFSGKDASVDAIISSAQTVAFMSEYRLVVLNDTGLFAPGRKDDSERLAGFVNEIPDTTVMLISENDVDKRGRLYKRVAEAGRAVEFKRPTERMLTEWVNRELDKAGKRIEPDAVRLLLGKGTGEMGFLYNELQKLTAYQPGPVIAAADVEAVCVTSPESKIFELVAAVGNRNPKRALEIFNDMLLLKESPIMVLSMIARQLRMILQCKHLSARGASAQEAAAQLGLRGFMVSGYLSQGRNFTEDGLIDALKRVLEADMDIKTGKRGDKLAVEVLIFELSGEGIVING